jgi:hypothetical protein
MIETLNAAMANARTVSFDYDDKPRIVEVHAVGTSTKDGSLLVRGYQVGGESSRPLPCWALFRLFDIEPDSLIILETPSQAPRPGYKMGDKQMREIHAQIELEEAA